MKDALGHGSDPRGTHNAGVDQVGRVSLTPSLAAMKLQMTGSATVPTSQSYPVGSWQQRAMLDVEASNRKAAGGDPKLYAAMSRGVWRSRADAKRMRAGG